MATIRSLAPSDFRMYALAPALKASWITCSESVMLRIAIF